MKAAILPASAPQQAFIRTTCHPCLKEKQTFHYQKKKRRKKKKAYALSLTYSPIFFKKAKNKSSSPQAKHNLTSKLSSLKGGERELRHAFTRSTVLVILSYKLEYKNPI